MREHLGEKLDAYLDETIDAAGRGEVEEHVRSCDACGRELRAMRALAGRLDAARPPEPPKTSFRAYWNRLLGRHGEVKTMSATQRLKRVVSSNVHAAIDSMEDPSKMIRQLLREMAESLAGARDELAEAMAHETRLLRKAETAESESRLWEDKAALALRNSREDLAREALAEKLDQACLAGELRDEAARQKARVAQLRGAYERLSRQFEELGRRKSMWLARAENVIGAARSSREAYRQAYDELGRIVGDIEGQGDKEEALAQLDNAASVTQELDSLSRAEVLEKELADLKRRLQK